MNRYAATGCASHPVKGDVTEVEKGQAEKLALNLLRQLVPTTVSAG